MFRWPAIFFISCTLSGCTMIAFTYFRNFTDQPVDILYSTNQLPFEKYSSSASYHKDILPIDRKIIKRVKDSLPIVYQGQLAILTVPPRSTIMVPRELFYDTVILLKQRDRTDTIRISHDGGSRNKFQYKGVAFPVTSIYYYDFK